MANTPDVEQSLERLSLREGTGMAAPTSVEEYLAALPEESRAALEKLRKTIKAAAPEATETIAYQMPAFKDHGRFLVSYAAFKDHCSLFPASNAVVEALGEELKPYFTGERNDPIPGKQAPPRRTREEDRQDAARGERTASLRR